MTQRDCFHGQGSVFIDYLLLVRVNGMEDDLEIESAAEGLELKVQKFLVLAWGIDVEWGRTAVKTECAYHSNQTENMVTVKMGYEHGIDLRKIET
jgi:hypothetical protein